MATDWSTSTYAGSFTANIAQNLYNQQGYAAQQQQYMAELQAQYEKHLNDAVQNLLKGSWSTTQAPPVPTQRAHVRPLITRITESL